MLICSRILTDKGTQRVILCLKSKSPVQYNEKYKGSGSDKTPFFVINRVNTRQDFMEEETRRNRSRSVPYKEDGETLKTQEEKWRINTSKGP